MPRYKLLIEYAGTHYSGWQRQPNALTVEEEIESALSQILQEPVDIIGQGRTDAGVHAEGQAAHFDVSRPVDKHKLLYGLLGELPRDIAVWDLQPVADDFHARFDAKSRQYRYQLVTRPSPLLNATTLLVADEIDWETMRACTTLIEGNHDFSSFSKMSDDLGTAMCEVQSASLKKQDYHVIFRIRANRFVHHMVRRLMGSLLQVGRGKWSSDQFADLLNHPHPTKNAHGSAAKGLTLEKVFY